MEHQPGLRNLTQTLGLLRSIVSYYGIPFQGLRMRRFYAQFMGPGDLCFDIGAHVGNRLAAWSKLGVRVIGVEPQPLCLWLLHKWFGRNPNITLVETAVGASRGEQTLMISNKTPTVSTLSQEWINSVRTIDSFAEVQWEDTIQVSVTTLDALIEQYGEPVFCKIDVEGYELEVLRGLSRPLAALSFEYIPPAMDIALGCIDRLEELDTYSYNWSVSEWHRWKSPHWLTADEMRAALNAMHPTTRSGDVYARRCV